MPNGSDTLMPSAPPYLALRPEEKAFLSGPVDTLCGMLNDWRINHELQAIPDDVLNCLKGHGFFGIRIPTEYDGLGFSTLACSDIICKIASVCVVVAILISAPEAWACIELLLTHGTDEQKKYYLPRLAKGEDILCAALSEVNAESSPGHGLAHGMVCQAEFAGQSQLCIRLSWQKQGVLCSSMASLFALGFHLHDPDRLLGDRAYAGLSYALIPEKTPGMTQHIQYHVMASACPVGAWLGKHVLIPIDWVVGGRDCVGQAGKCVSNTLSLTKAQSLAAVILGSIKKIMFGAGVFSRVCRLQDAWLVDNADVQKKLANMMNVIVQAEAWRFFLVTGFERGEYSPEKISIAQASIVKAHKAMLDDAMRMHGLTGMAIGGRHYLAQAYLDAPLLALLGNLESHDSLSSKNKSSTCFWQCFSLGVKNRSNVLKKGSVPYSEAHDLLKRLKAVVDLCDALCKETHAREREELQQNVASLSVVLAYIKASEHDMSIPVAWMSSQIVTDFFAVVSTLSSGVSDFFRKRLLRVSLYPIKRRVKALKQVSDKAMADLISEPSESRDLLMRHLYRKKTPNNPIGDMDELLMTVLSSKSLEEKVLDAKRRDVLAGHDFQSWVNEAVSKRIITAEEGSELIAMHVMRMSFICIDDLSREP